VRYALSRSSDDSDRSAAVVWRAEQEWIGARRGEGVGEVLMRGLSPGGFCLCTKSPSRHVEFKVMFLSPFTR
jgi:hypothetical protein